MTERTEDGWRLFTLEEAESLVPRLAAMMETLQRHVLALRAELARAGGGLTLEELATTRREDPAIAAPLAAIQETIREIEALGCHFKGVDLGLVDFPAIIDGEVAYYCWQHGEATIGWWHGLHEGFGGRRALEPSGTAAARHLN